MSVYKDKIAFFDFCETIANFQTADAFVDYIREKNGSLYMKLLEKLRSILCRLGLIVYFESLCCSEYSINKRLKLLQLFSFSFKKLDQYAESYYVDCIKPNLIGSIVDLLKEKQKEGYKIFIVSGGYGIYLKYFSREFGINSVISSDLKFKNGICLGMMSGEDCMGANKIRILDRIFNKEEISSIAYSDSASDLPLLQWADKAYVIKKLGKENEKWIHENNLNLVVWE